MRAVLPLLAVPFLAGFTASGTFSGEVDGVPNQTIGIEVTGPGELTGTEYLIELCIDDPNGDPRCTPLPTYLPFPAPAEPPDPPVSGGCRTEQDGVPIPLPPAGHICEPPTRDGEPVWVDFATIAASMPSGGWVLVDDMIVLEQHDVTFSKPSNLKADYNRLGAYWGVSADHARVFGRNPLYPLNGENKCPFSKATRTWYCHGGGHADSNMNGIVAISLEPLQVRLVQPHGYVPDPAAIGVDPPCSYPQSGIRHAGHTWGATTVDPTTDTVWIFIHQTTQNGGSVCPYQNHAPAWLVYSWTEADGLSFEGPNNEVVDGKPMNAAWTPGGIVHWANGTIHNGAYNESLDLLVTVSPAALQLRDPVTTEIVDSYPLSLGGDGLRHSAWDLRDSDGDGVDDEVWLVPRGSESLWRLDLTTGQWDAQPPPPISLGGRLWDRGMRWIAEWNVFVSMRPSTGFVLFKP